jgi:hypothetical protein
VENKEIQNQIDKILKELTENGIVVEKIVEELKILRELFKTEKMPRMVKLLRLTYEHIENYGNFNIAIPEDEGNDSDVKLSADELRIESLSYLVSLFRKPTQKLNAEDLDYYLHAFGIYDETH